MSRDKRSNVKRDDPKKRVWYRRPAKVSGVNKTSADDIQDMIDVCGDILEAHGFERSWPPVSGKNVYEVEENESAAIYAVRCIRHCNYVLSALEAKDVEKAVYDALRARETYHIATAREYGGEREMWIGSKSIASGQQEKEGQAGKDRELLKLHKEFNARDPDRFSWRAFAAHMVNREHNNDKPRSANSMTDREIGKYKKRIRDAQKRENTRNKR